MLVAPVKIVAVQDRNRHNLPPHAYNICKVFILCELIEGKFESNIETVQSGWFPPDRLDTGRSSPPILMESFDAMDSLNACSAFLSMKQVAMCFAAAENENWKVLFD